MSRTDDSKEVAKKKTKAAFNLREDQSYLKDVIDSYAGRAVIWDVLNYCRIYTKGFTGSELAFYNEGRRDVGLELIEKISEVDSKVMLKITEEAIERDERRELG